MQNRSSQLALLLIPCLVAGFSQTVGAQTVERHSAAAQAELDYETNPQPPPSYAPPPPPARPQAPGYAPPPPPPPPPASAQESASEEAPPIPPYVEEQAYAAPSGGYCYVGPHPADARYEAGVTWDSTAGMHTHAYPPFDLRLFMLRDNCYYFVGDPRDFGYTSRSYSYYGAHPILAAYGGGWCFMIGAHSHLWAPWSPHFALVGSSYYWQGDYDSYFWSYWPYYSHYYRTYYPNYYAGGRYYRDGYRSAPAIHHVPPPARAAGSPFAHMYGHPTSHMPPPGQPARGWSAPQRSAVNAPPPNPYRAATPPPAAPYRGAEHAPPPASYRGAPPAAGHRGPEPTAAPYRPAPSSPPAGPHRGFAPAAPAPRAAPAGSGPSASPPPSPPAARSSGSGHGSSSPAPSPPAARSSGSGPSRGGGSSRDGEHRR